MKKFIIGMALLSCPFNALAYSNEIILGGSTIGIEVSTEGVMIVGFYKVNGSFNRGSNTLVEGDYILKVNNYEVDSISELTKEIEKYINVGFVEITYKRGEVIDTTNLKLIESDGIYKTGLYLKESITGSGTLSFIDPESRMFSGLGHEILESSTSKIVEIKTGTIFRNEITSIDKSSSGVPGSKNAKFYYDDKYGVIYENNIHGIYGLYDGEVNDSKLIEVGSKEDIVIGDAVIYTVVDGVTIEEFDIRITAINIESDIKNLSLEIVDEDLLNKTGGVIQGMSGSPIVQNGKVIGVVTHVIVDSPNTGYGLFIETMLENADRIYESIEE